jgi:hypothetical protein
MSVFIRRFVLVLLPVLLVACGTRGPAGPPPPQGATLRVTNQSTSQMTIYVVASTQQIRLGSVPGVGTTTLRIPPSVVGLGREVSFRADPLGSRAVANSFRMYVRPGEQVTITIPSTVR